MRAVKGNREYIVTNENKAFYASQGFDILGESGEVLEYGKGKKVDYAAYADLKAENEALKQKIADLKAEKTKGALKKAGE